MMRSIRELTQQEGWKTQQSDKKMWRQSVYSQSYATFFLHSAVLSLPTVLLCKLPNRPFPSSPQSLFQSESKCEAFVMTISFNFNMKGN